MTENKGSEATERNGTTEAEGEAERPRLTDEQYTAAVSWLSERIPDHVCPMCGQDDFVIGKLVGIFSPSAILSGGTQYPCVPVICKNCAYTALFNAAAMGLPVPSPESDGKEEE